MFCKHISTVMEFDKSTFEMSRVSRQHPILKSDRYIRYTQCDSRWCCTECCVEDDSMDLPTFNRIYDCTEEQSVIGGPVQEGIVVKPNKERRSFSGDRVVMKIINPAYLEMK